MFSVLIRRKANPPRCPDPVLAGGLPAVRKAMHIHWERDSEGRPVARWHHTAGCPPD